MWPVRVRRNRLRACELAGVEPLTETREFADDAAVLRFVVSANLHRRHLDESQRAMVAAGIANLKPGRPSETSSIDPVSQTQAAEMMNVSVPSLKRAKEVITHGTPELQAAVQNGEIKVSKAAAIAKKPKEEQNAEVEKRKKVWEGMHPETRQGGAPAKKEGNGGKGKLRGKESKTANMATFDTGSPTEPFVKDTAKQTGQSERTVRRAAQIGKNLCREAAELLQDTPTAEPEAGQPETTTGWGGVVGGEGARNTPPPVVVLGTTGRPAAGSTGYPSLAARSSNRASFVRVYVPVTFDPAA